MVAFNPQTQDIGVPDMTGNSRGTGANRTFETLFSGIQNVAGNVLDIKDKEQKFQILEGSQGVFDQVNKEFGLEVPDGVNDGLETMKTLQNAVKQGKISEVNYYGRLATLSKQLRSKYPGYEDVVDQTIQSVTGTRPANAYRDAIFQEISAAAEGASSEQKFKRQWEKDNEGELAAIFGPEYFENPEAYDFQKVRAKVAGFKAEKTQIEAERDRLALANSQGDFNDKRAKRTIDRDFTFITSSVLNSSVGANSPSFSQKLEEFVAKGGGSAQETQEFISTISKAESDLRVALLSRGREAYVAAGLASNDDVNKAIEEAMYPLTKAKEAVLGGDFKLAGKFATITQIMKDEQVAGMMEDPTFRAGAGLDFINKALGDQYFGSRVLEMEDLALEVAGRTALGQQGALRSVIEHGNSKLSRDTLKSSFKVLTDPNLQAENFSNVIDQLFGPQAIDFMSPKVVAAEDLEKIYTDFLRPEVTQAVFSKGTEADKEKYTQWAYSKALAIPAFRAAAGDINTVLGMIPGAKVEFDEKNLRVRIVTTPSLGVVQGAQGTLNTLVAPALEKGMRAVGWEPYGRATNALNKVLATMKPIMEASGEDPVEGTKRLLKDLSVDINGQSPDSANPKGLGFFGWIWQAVGVSEAGASEGPSKAKGSALPEIPNSDSEIDFLFEQDESDLEDGLGSPLGSVASAGKGFTDVKVGDKTVRRQGSRAWRNNNPGNIEYGAFARSKGAIGSDGRFAVFDTYESGRKAKEALLFESSSYKDRTIAQAIARYAPPSENDTQSYARAVARAVGVLPTTKLSELSATERTLMLDAMEKVEGFKPGKEVILG